MSLLCSPLDLQRFEGKFRCKYYGPRLTICTRMILDEEQKLNPPPPIYSRDVDDKRASEWTGQHADFAPQQQQSTSTSYYAASPAGSSSLASTSAHPSFSRPRASGLPYQAFKSTYLAARGRSLDKGFSVSPPPSQEVPHPFVTHDVNEDDWLRCVVRAFSHEIGEYIFFCVHLIASWKIFAEQDP